MSFKCRFTAALLCLLQILSSCDAISQINFRSKRSDGASGSDVFLIPSGVRNKGWLKDESVKGDQYGSIALHCPASSVPFPSFSWFKDGERISQSENCRDDEDITIDEDFESDSDQKFSLYSTESILYLDCLDTVDAGNYTCEAEIGDSRKVRNIELTVETGDTPSNDKLKQCAAKGRAPKIYQKTGSVLEIPGNTVRLFCRASGYPVPTIKWLDMNNVTIQDSETFKTTVAGDLIVKVIGTSPDSAMYAVYACEATNDFGSDLSYSVVYPV